MDKEVYFVQYCPKCVYKDLHEDQDPCDDCLSIPYREDSHKPEYFKEETNGTAG